MQGGGHLDELVENEAGWMDAMTYCTPQRSGFVRRGDDVVETFRGLGKMKSLYREGENVPFSIAI